jgi:hypothetical protein
MMSRVWFPKVSVTLINLMQLYKPLLCNSCWNIESYYHEIDRKIIQFERNEIIFQTMKEEHLGYFEIYYLLLTLVPNELASLIFEYCDLYKRRERLEKLIYGQDLDSLNEQKQKMYCEWFKRQCILKEIIEKYVLDKPIKTTFKLFNQTISNSDFYLSNVFNEFPKDYHMLLSQNYISVFKSKKRKKEEEEEEQRKEEFLKFCNEVLIIDEFSNSGESTTSSDEDSICSYKGYE